MKGYKLSVVYMTYRPGGFDVLADSLKNQTYKNYELIVVNDYPDSAEVVEEYLLENDLPVKYCGPSKEKCYPDTPYGGCNAINTGCLHSTGDIMILVMDYAWLEPHALARWNMVFNTHGLNKIISGMGYNYDAPEPEVIDPISIWDPPFPKRFSFEGNGAMWYPHVFEVFYSGFPMKFLEEINGFDERADYWRENIQWGIIAQAELNNYDCYTDGVNAVKLVEHRGWHTFDSDLWHVNRWKVENLKKDIEWTARSPNCFDLQRDRR